MVRQQPIPDDFLLIALEDFTCDNPERIVRGFEVLAKEARRFLPNKIRNWVPERAEEDVLQETLIRFWEAQAVFENRGVDSWRRFMSQRAEWCAKDRLRREGRERSLDDFEIPVEMVLDFSHDWLQKLLGSALFGYCWNLPLKERNRRVLAAQLHYEQKLGWAEICDIVNGRPATNRDREDFNKWIKQISVLRDLSYRTLYRSGKQLCKYFLKVSTDRDLFQIYFNASEDMSSQEDVPGWNNAEILAIVFVFHFGLSIDRVLQRPENRLSREAVEELIVRCNGQMPFDDCMRWVLDTFGEHIQRIFDSECVYKRLALEYSYLDELSQKEVLLRLQSSAELAGYSLNSGILNMWLSGGRIQKVLKDYLGHVGDLEGPCDCGKCEEGAKNAAHEEDEGE